tara:strand:+ start:323 stop:1114 length:792 start_codon:yes stop_codon:yes gene_type:complete
MQINILGYGVMAKQIASLLYLGGFDINIWHYKDLDKKDLNRQIKLLKRMLPIDKTQEATLTFHSDLKSLPEAITIESVIENLKVKKKLYSFFEKSNNLYFINSSSFAPIEIGQNINALHFFNPINIKLLELYTVSTTVEQKISPIISYLNELEFSIVKVNNNRGYIGNYIFFNEISFALKLIEKYAYTIEQIDQVYDKIYEGRNLTGVIDLIGVDVVYEIIKNLKEEEEAIYLPNVLRVALDKNILGKKNKTSIRTLLSKENK